MVVKSGAYTREHSAEETQESAAEKVHNPSLATKDAMLKLAHEQHRRDVCNARLQDLEKELQLFSEEFGSRLHDLRVSMKEFIHGTAELRAFSGSLCPGEAKSGGLDFNGHDDLE